MIKKRNKLNMVLWLILFIFAGHAMAGSDKPKPKYYAGEIIGYSSSMLNPGDWEKISVIIHNRGKEALLQVKPAKLPPGWKVKPKWILKHLRYDQKEGFPFLVRISDLRKMGKILWVLNVIHKDGDWQSLDADFQIVNPPKIKVEPPSLHLKVGREKVSYDFILKNEGRSELLIRNITTSCGCTTALMKSKKGKPISPLFGENMNWKERRRWKGKRLKPGESVILTVSYDPLHHEGGSHHPGGGSTGIETWRRSAQTKRVVYIKSNDPNTPELEIPITIEEKR